MIRRYSSDLPTLSFNDRICMRVRMIFNGLTNPTIDDGFHFKIVKDSLGLIRKLTKIILLNSKADFKTIRFRCFSDPKKIQTRNTAFVHSRNIVVRFSVVVRCCAKTLSISKWTLRPKTKTAHKIITIILVRSTIRCIQFLHIFLTKTSTIITHGKIRISLSGQNNLKRILITCCYMSIISISRKLTNNCHNLIGIKRIRKDFKHFASLSDCKLIRTIKPATVNLNRAICQLHCYCLQKVKFSCDPSSISSIKPLVKH